MKSPNVVPPFPTHVGGVAGTARLNVTGSQSSFICTVVGSAQAETGTSRTTAAAIAANPAARRSFVTTSSPLCPVRDQDKEDLLSQVASQAACGRKVALSPQPGSDPGSSDRAAADMSLAVAQRRQSRPEVRASAAALTAGRTHACGDGEAATARGPQQTPANALVGVRELGSRTFSAKRRTYIPCESAAFARLRTVALLELLAAPAPAGVVAADVLAL